MLPATPTLPRSPVVLAPDDELPFQAEMFREFNAGNVHFFILYFNIHDYVFVPSFAANPNYVPQRLRNYLGELLRSRGFEVVLYYSLAGGLSYLDQANMQPRLTGSIPENVRHGGREYGQSRNSPQDIVSWNDESVVALSYLDRVLSYTAPGEEDSKDIRQPPHIGVIIEYLESLAPHEDAIQRGPNANFIVQMLHRWAMDRRLRQRHIVIGLASDLSHIASSLYAAGSECRAYRVDLPVEEIQALRPGSTPRHQRRDWLQWLIAGLSRYNLTNPLTFTGSISSVEALASQTSGFNYDNLRDLVYYAARSGQPLTVETVQRRKRDIITAESRDLLEIVEPRYGFEVVAGYKYIKEYLSTIKQAILNQGIDPTLAAIVPKGILFLGPPGTGKSFVAAALAKETGFNMVKLRNIRSMWVGESERNLNRVLDLLSAMYPVIVFVDEVDQALGTRQVAGGDGASGVEQRIFQRILEFMAMDEYRGRVLWIAASNRPDGIDPALLSRFDIIMPFLLPDAEARKQMLLDAYPRKIGYRFEPLSDERLCYCVNATNGFSGRELDTICRRALQIAAEDRLKSKSPPPAEPTPVVTAEHILRAIEDFRQARDLLQYELQTLLAIQNTNFYSFLPSRSEMPAAIVPMDDTDRPLDEEKLRNRINELSELIGRRRLAERGFLLR